MKIYKNQQLKWKLKLLRDLDVNIDQKLKIKKAYKFKYPNIIIYNI